MDAHDICCIELLQADVLVQVILGEQLAKMLLIWLEGFIFLEVDGKPIRLSFRVAIEKANHEFDAHFIYLHLLFNHLSIFPHQGHPSCMLLLNSQ